MPVFKMAFNGYSVQFSPFDDRLAVGAAQNFGIIGNGKQYVLQARATVLFAPICPESGFAKLCIENRMISTSLSLRHLTQFLHIIIKQLLQMTPNGLVPVAEYDTRDGVYDCAWSEVNHISADTSSIDLLHMLCSSGLSSFSFKFFLSKAQVRASRAGMHDVDAQSKESSNFPLGK